ncbi:hypothetical protein ES319_D08G265700v1 [Gossypium barbadense]|uniref:Dirigent protein n=1 Tax=Gossypium barbadense TaxID=3634 RepID=A0A5J5QKE7_GOSBA|nr:hypothetical protein ES319_D08G265700v1 [Gossypium barbadense]
MKGTLVSTRFLMVCLSKMTVTHLHFFLHETLGGKNPLAVEVAQANISSLPFGTLYAIDDILNIGLEDNSEVIGNAQGLALTVGGNTTTGVMYVDFGFTKGKFKGSSISLFSRNPITNTEREVVVVGGRGKFRIAKGFALLKTYFLNATTVIVDFNVTLIHTDPILETQFSWIVWLCTTLLE